MSRSWQCATIQCDFTLPERFGLTYVDKDGERKRPVMIHRVVLGAIERFLGVLIEHYAGAFPLWLSPVQATVMTITDRHIDYGRQVKDKLLERGVRVEIDDRNEKIGFKIREARNQKIPYMLIVGDKEVEQNTIGVRKRGEDATVTMSVDDYMVKFDEQVKARA